MKMSWTVGEQNFTTELQESAIQEIKRFLIQKIKQKTPKTDYYWSILMLKNEIINNKLNACDLKFDGFLCPIKSYFQKSKLCENIVSS
jgi:hypothetical protein